MIDVMYDPDLDTGTGDGPGGTRGFAVPCLGCGRENGVTVCLDDTATFSCSHCKVVFEVADVRAALDSWGEVLAWVGKAPKRP